jgi:hypothetical protein
LGLGARIRSLLFGRIATQEYRDAVHDNKNAMHASSGAAWRSKKQAEEALRAAQCAIKLLEQGRDRQEKK